MLLYLLLFLVCTPSISFSPLAQQRGRVSTLRRFQDISIDNNSLLKDTKNNENSQEILSPAFKLEDDHEDTLPQFSGIVDGLAMQPLGSLKMKDIEFLVRFIPKAPGWIPRTIEAAKELESILKRLIDEKRIRVGSDLDVAITAETYAAVVEVWAMNDISSRAQEIHDAMIAHNFIPPIDSYSALLLAWRNNVTKAEEIWDEIMERKLQLDHRTVYRMLDVYVRASHHGNTSIQNVQKFEEIFESMQSFGVQRNIYTYVLLQRLYARNGRPNDEEKSIAVVKRLRDLFVAGDENAKPHVMHCNQVLSFYSNQHSFQAAKKALDFLQSMERPIDKGGFDVKPDRMSYSLALKACAFASDAPVFAAEKSEEILELLEKKAKEEEEQQGLISSAAPLQFSLRVQDFNSVLLAISRDKSKSTGPNKAIRIIKRMQQYADDGKEGLQPTIKTWNALLQTLARNVWNDPRLLKKGEKLVDWLLSSHQAGMINVKPDAYTYNGLLCLYQASDDKEAPVLASKTLSNIERMVDEGAIDFRPDVYYYTIVLGSWSSSKRVDACDEMLKVLAKAIKRTRPTTRLFDTALSGLASRGKGQSAEEILDYMMILDRKGYSEARPSLASFTEVIFAHVKSGAKGSGKRAEEILSRLISFHDENRSVIRLGFRPFQHIIRYYMIDPAPDAPYRGEYVLNIAISLIRDGSMKATKIPLSVIVDVMQSYGRTKHPDVGHNAERLLKLSYALQEESILDQPVSSWILGEVIHAWGRSDDQDKGHQIEVHLKSMIEAYDAGNQSMRPTATMFNTLLRAWASLKCPNRPRESLRCRQWILDVSQKIGVAIGPEECSSLVLLSCNLLKTSPKEQHIEQAFAIGKEMFDDIMALPQGPSLHTAFAWYLQTLSNLDDQDRRKFDEAERCFRLCRISGLVSPFVWKVLFEYFPASFAEKVANRKMTTDIPASWRRNLRNRNSGKGPSTR